VVGRIQSELDPAEILLSYRTSFDDTNLNQSLNI
jgi:hypothetical protein